MDGLKNAYIDNMSDDYQNHSPSAKKPKPKTDVNSMEDKDESVGIENAFTKSNTRQESVRANDRSDTKRQMQDRKKGNSTMSSFKYPLTAASKHGRKTQTNNDLK